MNAPKQILAFVGDLFFSVRLADVIRQLGYHLQLVETATQLQQELALKPDLVILDLALVDRWEQAVQTTKADAQTAAIPMLAFGAHMNIESQQRGRAAGVDRIVANSKFATDLPSLITQLVNTSQP